MVHTLTDLTGNGGAQKLIATRTVANWIQFTIPLAANGATGTNSAQVRVGDSNVSTSRGTVVPLNGMLFPPISDGQYMDLSQIYFYAATNDKLQVTYGTL